MIDVLSQIIRGLFGAGIVVGLLLFVYKRDAVDWEQLARVYGKPWQTPRLHKRFANMILYSEGRPSKSYQSTMGIGLHDDGIALRPNRLLVPFQPPVFIPYADIRGWGQDWYINADSTELSFAKTPHMRVIMPRDQVEWMLSLAKGTVYISETRPPHGTRPWLTYVTALASVAMAIVVILVVLANGLPNA